MKKSRFSEEQIIEILREAQSGSSVKVVCAQAQFERGQRPHSSLGYQTPEEFGGRRIACSQLRSGYALPPLRTSEGKHNIKPMAKLYL